MNETPRERDVHAVFATAEGQGRVGIARKTKPVDARPAQAGEVIITLIKSEGHETRSKPAAEGDWVVRNRCPATGNEEYLVKAEVFAKVHRRIRLIHIIAGLGPAIHNEGHNCRWAWMPASSPGVAAV